jgi:hypothetical protein
MREWKMGERSVGFTSLRSDKSNSLLAFCSNRVVLFYGSVDNPSEDNSSRTSGFNNRHASLLTSSCVHLSSSHRKRTKSPTLPHRCLKKSGKLHRRSKKFGERLPGNTTDVLRPSWQHQHPLLAAPSRTNGSSNAHLWHHH